MHTFSAKIEIIGVNPFVFVPAKILQQIFNLAGKTKGHIPIKNSSMLKDSPKRIGETARLTIQFDPESREVVPHTNFVQALAKNKAAKVVFEQLSSSRQLEIVRYISKLKTEEARAKNIQRAIDFLLGKELFIGRDKPGIK